MVILETLDGTVTLHIRLALYDFMSFSNHFYALQVASVNIGFLWHMFAIFSSLLDKKF